MTSKIERQYLVGPIQTGGNDQEDRPAWKSDVGMEIYYYRGGTILREWPDAPGGISTSSETVLASSDLKFAYLIDLRQSQEKITEEMAAAQETAELTSEQILLMEKTMCGNINQARAEAKNGAGQLTRIEVLDLGSAFAAQYCAENRIATHAVPREALLRTATKIQNDFGCGSVTEAELDSLGITRGTVARSTQRDNLASIKTRADGEQYASSGGVTEVTVVAQIEPGLTNEQMVEKMFNALMASEPHKAAMLGTSSIHFGCYAYQSENTIAIVVGLGSGANGSVGWAKSTRGQTESNPTPTPQPPPDQNPKPGEIYYPDEQWSGGENPHGRFDPTRGGPSVDPSL